MAVALQVVFPGVKSLINGVSGWDVEERAARVVATVMDVLAWCASDPGGDTTKLPGLRQHTLTCAEVGGSGPVGAGGVRRQLLPPRHRYRNTDGEEETETERFDDLVGWVRRHGRVGEDAVRLVVLTRTAGVSVEELAAAQDVDPQTLRPCRLRAERRVRQSLSLAR